MKEQVWVSGTTKNGFSFKITSKSLVDRSMYFGYVFCDGDYKNIAKNKNPLIVEETLQEYVGVGRKN